ncbi:SUKH-4 family immunity protein [Micromonospora sp. NBC_01796]|uniref:SUKH-4 family immunity protein n=1 Tax=Micromonospora sp. NBC_01796 TaxID=2975987 RepID=UPI002DD7F86F|nr:SUKH-4 family immunity protein [Micromonospora sp. NBC_01796]WSA88847.1 SUKH-4 family immunity protein [Micromonospora sp. NBC_01796]
MGLLAALRPITYAKVPVEGRWLPSPLPERAIGERVVAVLCEDPDVACLVVDRTDGTVLITAGDEAPVLVNRSLDQLVESSRIYSRAARRARRIDEEDDEALEALAVATAEQIGRIDPDAVRDENQLWAAAAEELGYGL